LLFKNWIWASDHAKWSKCVMVVVCRQYMLDSGYECELKESDSFDNVDVLHQYLINNFISCIIGIHALRAGKLLRGSCLNDIGKKHKWMILLLAASWLYLN